MEARLKNARNKLALIAKEQQESKAQEKRWKEKYFGQLDQVSFLKDFRYDASWRPGSELMGKLGRKRFPARVFIPDTIVIRPDGSAVWLFTCSKGFLKRTTRFVGRQILERLGDIEFPKDAIAVQKSPVYSGYDKFSGNKATVLDTEMLYRVLTQETRVPMALDNNLRHMNRSEDTYPMVIQRFIKGKGHKSHIMRTRWAHGKKTRTWMITNSNRYDDTEKEPNENLRLINDAEKAFGVDIVVLTRKASAENESLTNSVREHVQAILGRRILEIVVDTMRDDDGHLWFLQVQAYRAVPGQKQSIPPELSLRETFRMAESRRSMLPPMLEKRPQSAISRGKTANRRPDSAQGKKTLTRIRSPEYSLRSRCKFCSSFCTNGKPQFMMTTQMILETSGHLKRRMDRDQYNFLFSGQRTGDMGLDASRLYHAHYVCAVCYELYQKEVELAGAGNEFADLLGVPLPPDTVDTEQKDKVAGEDGSGRRSPRSPGSVGSPGKGSPKPKSPGTIAKELMPRGFSRRTTVVGLRRSDKPSIVSNALFGEAEDPSVAESSAKKESNQEDKTCKGPGKEVFVSSMPELTTLCRLMLAIHELHELPDVLFTSIDASEEIRPKYDAILRFEVLGRQYEIPLDLYNCTFKKESGRRLSNLQVKELRIFPFFAEDTPKEGPLPNSSGVSRFISSETELVIQLCVRHKVPEHDIEGLGKPYVMLGKCHLPLLQFKSAFLKRTDMMIPLGFSSELCEMRVSVGLERTRENFNSSSVEKVRLYKGIYVPEDHFFSCDPLPNEWVLAISNEPDKPSLQQQRHSFRDLMDEGDRIIQSKSPNKALDLEDGMEGESYHASSSSDAVCVQVSIESARNLPLSQGWPCLLYAQYQFLGEWFTTRIVAVEKRNGQGNFEFGYRHKHYIRTTDEDAMARLMSQTQVQVVLISPLTRCETVANNLLAQIVKAIGEEHSSCFIRKDLVVALETWTSLVRKYQEREEGYKEAFEKLVEDGLKEFVDIDTIDYLPVFELGLHLRHMWEDRLQSAITQEEALYTCFVLLRMHFFFSEVSNNAGRSLNGKTNPIRMLEDRLTMILHPSHRKMIEPELMDKIQHLHDLLLGNLQSQVKEETNELSWDAIVRALASAFRSVEDDPIKECFKSMDSLPHRVLMSIQPEDRVAFSCKIQVGNMLEGEDTIDGTFSVGQFPFKQHRRDSFVSCYTSPDPMSLDGGSSHASSSRLPSSASSSTTCTFSSLDSPASSPPSSSSSLTSPAAPRQSMWTKLLGSLSANDEGCYDVAEMIYELDEREETNEDLSDKDLSLIRRILNEMLDTGREMVSLQELQDAQERAVHESQEWGGLILEAGHEGEEEEGHNNVVDPRKNDEKKWREQHLFPPYLHTTLIIYRSVFISDEQERPDLDRVQVTQSKAVASFCRSKE